MGKKHFPSSNNQKNLTHVECRAKVCLVCFEVKKNLRDIAINLDWVQHLKTVVGPNFDIADQRHPSGLCMGCKLKYFSVSAIEDETEFTIPQYLYKVVVSSNDGSQTCDCMIC